MTTEPATSERRTEVERRLDAVRMVLDRRALSAVLLTSRRSFSWLTLGGLAHVVLASETGVAGILVTARDAVVVTSGVERDRIAGEELAGLGIEVVAVPWWEKDGLAAEARRRGGAAIASEAEIEDDLVPLRSVLAPIECERLLDIGQVAARAMTEALEAFEHGTTEEQLARDLERRLVGYRAPVVLVAADERIAAYRHPLPTALPIRRRVMLVLVAERWGIHAAITRFRELEPPDTGLAARFAAVAQVERAMHEATRPGATLGDVFAAAQAAYADVGLAEEWRLHHQGGTIAYQARERIATPNDPTPMEAGMAFAWNPSIAGVKTEDTFILEADGSRRIVTMPVDMTAG
jgi:Xaa-Pro aminopeptidase